MLLTPVLHEGEIWNVYLVMPPDGSSAERGSLEFEPITGTRRETLSLSREAPPSLLETLRRGEPLDRGHLLRELEAAAKEG